MAQINPQEKSILTVLLKYDRFLPAAFIARKAKVSWNTADKYLRIMHEEGWVEMRGKTKKFYRAIVSKDVKW